MVERDCNSCAHHIQAGGIDKTPASCWSCLASEGLPYWCPDVNPYLVEIRKRHIDEDDLNEGYDYG